jgi:predicted SAM-dependent methyltransferase
MRNYLAKNKVKSLLSAIKGPVKLNIGCGTDYKEGWINIDNNSDNNIEKLDFNWDLRNPLPFAGNSVDFIFNEHLIEHLTVAEAHIVIKDLMRVLKPGGVMRIAMPDLETAVDQYLNLPLSKDPTIKRFKLDYIKTRAERINMAFREWGHMWLYDAEELKRRLKEAGCKNIKQCKLGESTYPSLRNLETREESILIMEIKK